MKKKVIVFVNSDHFVVSHRLWLCTALRSAGYEAVIAAADTGASAKLRELGFRFEALPIHRGGMNPLVEARSLLAVTQLYRRERPDIVHHASPKAIIYGSLAAQAARVPAIINTMSGLGYAMIVRPNDPPKVRALRATVTTLYRAALRRKNTFNVFQNPDQRDLFLELGLIRPGSATLVRGSGVDTSKFTAAPMPSGDPIVMLPGRLLWDKGVGEFVDAARSLKAKHPKVRFVIVGGEDESNPARIPLAEVRKWEAEKAIEWWGFRKDMPAVFREATLVVLPSYAEGLPLALAEAAGTARPCVTTDVPGCREVVLPGINGWRVPVRDAAALANAIDEALSDKARLEAYGKAGRKHVEDNLALERVEREMLAVYERAAKV